MTIIMLISFIIMVLLTLLMTLLFVVSMKTIVDREKMSPFECGFNPIESSRLPFSSHFFIIAVLFLVFDVELVIIMPMMINLLTVNMMDLYIIMMMFLLFLIIGLYHEWYNKKIEWV